MAQVHHASSSATSSTASGGGGGGGPSLVFGGGGSFLSKYHTPPAQTASVASADATQDADGQEPRNRRVAPRDKAAKDDRPERVNVRLNNLIVNSRTGDQILQVVEAHIDHFNAVNLITALHRLATVVVNTRRTALRRDVRFKRIIHKLSETLMQVRAELKPQDLSNASWALTKLGLINAALFARLSSHVTRTIGDFQPVNLSMTLWAFARSGLQEESVYKAAVVVAKVKLYEFQPQQLANTCWALARSGHADHDLFDAAAYFALSRLDEYLPVNYSMLLYSFALAKFQHPELFEEVGKLCTVRSLSNTPSAPHSAPHVVTNLALAFSDCGMANREVFDAIAQVSVTTMHDFKTQQVVTLVRAFAKASMKHDQLLTSIAGAVASRVSDFRQTEINEIVASFESLGVSSQAITRALTAHESQGEWPSPWTVISAILVSMVILLVLWHAAARQNASRLKS